jgi:hypothetical protein
MAGECEFGQMTQQQGQELRYTGYSPLVALSDPYQIDLEHNVQD